MLSTDLGQTIRVPVDGIRVAGRNTQGVTLFRTGADEHVVGVERIAEGSEPAGNGDNGDNGENTDDEPGEAEREGADEPGPEAVTAEAKGLEAPNSQAAASPEFFYWNRP